MLCWVCNTKMLCKDSRPLGEGHEWKRKYVCPKCGESTFTVETMVMEGEKNMMAIENCVLGRKGCASNCVTDPSVKRCEGCGWDRDIAQHRKSLLRENGLEEISDARKAHIRKEWGMNTNREMRGLKV